MEQKKQAFEVIVKAIHMANKGGQFELNESAIIHNALQILAVDYQPIEDKNDAKKETQEKVTKKK
jgi:hypothetical protein